ncbi:hypothetical protein MKW98_012325 [Papaver atlanticum]|uniref:Glycosyltransferase subfamily 4-like N-terminal domain-containing protein n=1 Tax=Papaver atlanticum TaxID=357466 RepID=A0AAD4T226_9MAGN|nr:hypothetical protein MKW98_012325 [Papaver atlanticum]
MAGQKLEEKIGKRGRAAVVVLGDIVRSPRMQYHALSLARQAFLEVDIVAYGGSDPHAAILENRSIRIHKMTQLQVPHGLPKMLYPVILLCKALTQFFMLLWFLCYKIPAPDVFIVQNPPSVPTLVAVKWDSWLRHSAIIVDMHNFGYTLLGLSMGRSSPFVKVYRWIEKHYGKIADGSLCVTQAMQHDWLRTGKSKQLCYMISHQIFFILLHLRRGTRLSKDISHPHGFRDFVSAGYKEMDGNVVNENTFTYQVDSDIRLKSGRPVLVVSSTSR